MKRIITVLLCFALIFGCVGCSGKVDLEKWKDDGVLKILAIGNSFSADTLDDVCQMAHSLGIEEVFLGNVFLGGCSLATHSQYAQIDFEGYTYYTTTDGEWDAKTNSKMSDALKAENWDYISLQQASGQSGLPDTYDVVLDSLVEYVTDAVPDATLIWNMTWAYQQDSGHVDFKNYDNDQTTMYNAIVDTVNEKIVDNKNFKLIVPAGTAIQNARTSFVGDNLTADGYHLSHDLGRYIAGLTLLKQVTGIEIDDIEFAPDTITEKQKKVAIEAVNNAIENPFEVTESEYK